MQFVPPHGRFENPKAPKAMPAIVNIGDAFTDSFAKDFTLEVDRIKARGPD